MPLLTFATPWSGLVPCGKSGAVADPSNINHLCTFNDILDLINIVINFTFQALVVPIAAIMFAFAGFKMITAGGESSSARTTAKDVFTNTALGLIIAAGCFIFIKALLLALGYDFTSSISGWF